MRGTRSILILLTMAGLCFSTAHAEDGGLESLRETGKAFASIAQAVSPSVVSIQVEAGGGPASQPQLNQQFPFGNDFFEHFFGEIPQMQRPQRPQRRTVAQGSGFVYASDEAAGKSYILTNNHVVEDASRIRVVLQDGREFDATVKGRDPQSDVAVIEIPVGGLPSLPLGDSSKLQVGEWVIAIGNPFGLSQTLTVGVVSATGRTSIGINDYEDFIQTDAAINPGNSGGPLLDLDGRVIGISTAIFSRSGGYMGVGFAIPIDLAETIAQQLIDTGEVTRGYLGIIIQTLTPELAESFSLDRTKGILVADVSADSPAARGGLRQGDIITHYQGRAVEDIGDFRNRVALTAPGSSESITVLRNGEPMDLTLDIGSRDESAIAAAGAGPQTADAYGLTVQTITPDLARAFGVRPGEGVVVIEAAPGSVAALAGITSGTVILQVNRQPVRNATEFRRALAQAGPERVLLLVRKDGVQQFIVLGLGR